MRKLTSVAASTVLAFAGLSTMAGTPAQAAAQAEYVALGDSYASGVGAGTYDAASGDCKRSPSNYPHQWAAANPEYKLNDVSCSGATIADVRNNQLSALSSSTSLVTLTVGGNDAQFSSVVQGCLTQNDSYCQTATLWMSYYAQHQMVDDLAALYKDIKARAPKALILVFGYPEVLSSSGTCPVIDLDAAKRTYMNGFADALAEGTRAASVKEPVYFVDMRKQFTGHGACGSDSWFNDLTNASAVFHPNLAGYTNGYAAKFKATWGKSGA
ncbi:SGNH/GDSL hydrolase family protein [Streptomyces sp. NPDC048277]|uniref:SGNH/GDSL hydrolase family protein n=1 Tax=Streptomyces sp. NPDC048277 TaxID=3155027 RepID=UPI0033C39991